MSGFIPDTRGWLDGHRRPRRKDPAPSAPAEVAVKDGPGASDQEVYGITVAMLKCPNPVCRSLKIKRYKTQPVVDNRRIKYYKCLECGHRFRVTEVNRG